MPLVRSWARGLSGASGAALLVPGGIFAALALLALAGSFGRLGGLGQAFTGPAAAGQGPSAAALISASGHAPALLPVVAAPSGSAVAQAARTATAAGAATGAAPSASGGHEGGSPGGGGAGQPGSPSGPGAGTTTGAGCGSSCSPPAPHQTLVDQVVAVGTSVTSKLPGAVGELATQLLKQVGATVDRVVPDGTHAGIARTVNQVGSTLSQLKLP